MKSDWGYPCAAKAALLMFGLMLPGWQLLAAAGGCPQSAGVAIAATPVSATAAALFWQVAPGSLAGGPVRYSLYRGTSPTNLAQLAQTTRPFYKDLGLSPATAYIYVVQAVESNGTAVSGTACPTTPPLPNPPSEITATPLSPTQLRLSWAEQLDANSLAISAFRVYGGTSPTSLAQLATVRDVSITLNLAAGTTYYFAIEAFDVDGDASAISVIIQVTMPIS